MYDRDHEWLSSQSSELAGCLRELERNDVAVKLPPIGELLSAGSAPGRGVRATMLS
jgi:hypothetical protein